MFKVTIKDFTSPQTRQALASVFNCKTYPEHKFKYQLAKMCRRCEEENDIIAKNHSDLLKKYVRLDDKGNIEPYDGRPGTFRVRKDIEDDAEKMEEFKKEMEDFNATEVEVDSPKIPLSKLEKVGLSPAELSALEPFIINMEDVSSGSKS